MAETPPIWFFGTPAFAERILRGLVEDGAQVTLVVCQPDRPKGRGHEVQACEVKRYAENEECSLFQPGSLRKDEEARQFLESLAVVEKPALAVVAAYGQILPEWLLALPQRGFVNVHASLLPRWRGASPIAHSIWAGDKETGVSLMEVVPALDAGPVLATRATVIGDEDDTPGLEARLSEEGTTLLVECLGEILSGELEAVSQDEALVTYAPRLEKRHAALDWTRPAAELERQVRALRPWPGTSSEVRGKQLKILRVRVAQGSGEPGEVLEAGERLVVACGEGALELLEVQLQGKKPVEAEPFLRGFSLKTGDRFASSKEPNPAPQAR